VVNVERGHASLTEESEQSHLVRQTPHEARTAQIVQVNAFHSGGLKFISNGAARAIESEAYDPVAAPAAFESYVGCNSLRAAHLE